jgi:nitrate/TMAO reductase-like tetraheme cytochrome c subunit
MAVVERYGRKLASRILEVFKKRALTFSVGFGFALLCFVTLNAAMEPVSTSTYCGTTCHEEEEAYRSWQQTTHSVNENGLRAECIDCHLPSKDKYFTHILAKAYAGGRAFYGHYFGNGYNEEKNREEVLRNISNEPCLRCHVDLLAKPSSDEAKEAHTVTLKPSDPSEQTKCIDCHEDVGHQRTNPNAPSEKSADKAG